MNKREIDDMMRHLPSQKPEEPLWEKVVIGLLFIAFLVFWLWIPDFELTDKECMDQKPSAYVGNLCAKP